MGLNETIPFSTCTCVATPTVINYTRCKSNYDTCDNNHKCNKKNISNEITHILIITNINRKCNIVLYLWLTSFSQLLYFV